jgi:hypothetical protein
MQIREFLAGRKYFDLETVETMNTAFLAACGRLGLLDKKDPLTRMVAFTVIELAEGGIKDAQQLTEAALREIERPRPPAYLGQPRRRPEGDAGERV